MENNSSRRSSDAEHQLIAKQFDRTLHRQGIRFEQDGIPYLDSRSAFQLINAYRTYLRLFVKALHSHKWDDVDDYWLEGVGKAQGEVVWLLQRLCEKNRPFYPVNQNFNGFNRSFEFYNWLTRKDDLVVTKGQLHVGLGSDFAFNKDSDSTRGCKRWGSRNVEIDLVAVCNLIEDAKVNILELPQALGLHPKN